MPYLIEIEHVGCPAFIGVSKGVYFPNWNVTTIVGCLENAAEFPTRASAEKLAAQYSLYDARVVAIGKDLEREEQEAEKHRAAKEEEEEEEG